MLELTIEQPSTSTLFPNSEGRPVGEWRDSEGEVCAYGWVCDDGRRICFPGLATYAFAPGGRVVTATPTLNADLEAVRETFYHSVLPLALQSLGWEALHASAVTGPKGVLALCAVSGTGKSTLAYALGRAGYRIWADDAVVISQREGVPKVAPLPFSLRLRAASRAYFAEPESTLRPWQDDVSDELPLAAVCILGRDAASEAQPPVRVRRLTAAEAFPALLEHAYCFDLADDHQKPRMIDHYLMLADAVAVYAVCFKPGFEHLPELVERVARVCLLGEEVAP